MKTMAIENKQDAAIVKMEKLILAMAERYKSINEFTAVLRKALPDYIVGRGGSHVWIANKTTNGRVAIIYWNEENSQCHPIFQNILNGVGR